MRNLTLGDLRLGLRDLLGDKLPDLRASATGKLYEPRLRAKQKELEALPDAASVQAPLAKELGENDVRHDAYGAAVFYCGSGGRCAMRLRKRAALWATGTRRGCSPISTSCTPTERGVRRGRRR